jgi:very-short-patch-repair endonuclease
LSIFIAPSAVSWSHNSRTEYDAERAAWLEQRGYRVVRFANEDVIGDIQAVLRQIETLCTA